jgi:hypothetical protein
MGAKDVLRYLRRQGLPSGVSNTSTGRIEEETAVDNDTDDEEERGAVETRESGSAAVIIGVEMRNKTLAVDTSCWINRMQAMPSFAHRFCQLPEVSVAPVIILDNTSIVRPLIAFVNA